MSKLVPNIKLETLLIGVFFASVVLFGFKKCQSDRANYVKKNSTAGVTYTDGRPEHTDTLVGDLAAPKPQTYSAPPVLPTATETTPITSVPKLTKPVLDGIEGEDEPAASPQTTTTTARSVPQIKTTTKTVSPEVTKTVTRTVERSILYITIDRLKVRKEPSLKSPVVVRLKLHEKVYFAGERTEFKEEINLGYKAVNEPWLKIETQGGKIGWVFGAGVDILKTVQDGVMNN